MNPENNTLFSFPSGNSSSNMSTPNQSTGGPPFDYGFSYSPSQNQQDDGNDDQEEEQTNNGDGSAVSPLDLSSSLEKRKRGEKPQVDYETDFEGFSPIQCYEKLLGVKCFGTETNRFLKELLKRKVLPAEFETKCGSKIGKNNAEKTAQRAFFVVLGADRNKTNLFHSILKLGEKFVSLTKKPSYFFPIHLPRDCFFQGSPGHSHLQSRPVCCQYAGCLQSGFEYEFAHPPSSSCAGRDLSSFNGSHFWWRDQGTSASNG
jgi:hypothetical protein